jgi:alkanesulfonate monooxygenase SsuD/methylene tetrahydromethanopterin reductase-like flavin-dependent oxidoreductase (luciferase family)
MKYGLYVPPFGDYANARVLADLAKDAESAGWDGFFTWDHLVMGWHAPVVDPWVAYSAIALATQRIRFGPLVTPLPRRRPWKVARETVSLDHLSGGRLIFGVGIGGGDAEFGAFSEPEQPKELGERLDEALEVLTGLWSGEPFHFNGCHYQVKEAQFLPRPVQSPRIPIWVGGFWPNRAPFRRAARWDGVFPLNLNQEEFLTPQQVKDIVAYIKRFRTDEAPFDVAHSGFTSGNDAARAAEQVAPYAAAGVTWWLENVNPWRFGWDMEGSWPVEAMRERILQGPPLKAG